MDTIVALVVLFGLADGHTMGVTQGTSSLEACNAELVKLQMVQGMGLTPGRILVAECVVIKRGDAKIVFDYDADPGDPT